MAPHELPAFAPTEVALRQGPLHADPADLPAEEEQVVARAVAGRRNAFAAGRAYAREALDHIGHPVPVIGSRTNRSPVWPASVVGSIAHTSSWAVAAVAPITKMRTIGVDVETISRVGTDLTERLTTPGEQQYLHHPGMLGIIFSIKEAIYKAQHPVLELPLGFRDVTLELSVPDKVGTVQVQDLTLTLVWQVTDDRVLSLAYCPAST